MNFLYTAYASVWIIHLVYVGYLVRRYVRLRKEIGELGK